MTKTIQRARTDDDKGQRREALLTAALDAFFDRGFAATRIDDIAKLAGVSKGTVYLYFDSKEDLFRELVAKLTRPKLDFLETAIGQGDSFLDAIDQLAVFAPGLLQVDDMPKLMKIIVGASRTFPDLVSDYRRNVIERGMGFVSAAIERAQHRGEVRPDIDAKLAARLVIAPVAMSGLWRTVFGHDPEAHVDVQALLRLHAQNMRRALAA